MKRKHISATLLTVFCLFTAGLVARSYGGPAASGESGGDGAVITCESGYSKAVGAQYTGTYNGYDLNYYRANYPGVLLCVEDSSQKLAIMYNSGRIERIDID